MARLINLNPPPPQLQLLPGMLSAYAAIVSFGIRSTPLPAAAWLSSAAVALAIATALPLEPSLSAIRLEGFSVYLFDNECIRELGGAIIVFLWSLRSAARAAAHTSKMHRYVAYCATPFVIPLSASMIALWWFFFAERERLGGALCGSPIPRGAKM